MKCAVRCCQRLAEHRGWCSMHYQRWRHHGDPTVTMKHGPRIGRPLSSEQREKMEARKALADPTDRLDILGRRMTRVHSMTYAAVHQRLHMKARGPCVRCGHPGDEWALKDNASEKLHDKNGTFSPHESDYEPMCTKCHRHADGNSQTMWDRHYEHLMSSRARGANHGCAKLTERQVMQIKEQRAAGVKLWKLSSKYGVSMAQISRIALGQSWRKSLNGFSLIELLVVCAIIGILAAIAIPAYQDYATRSKITELISAADACKVSVTEYYQTQSAFPTTMAQAACNNQPTKYVASLDVAPGTGVITVTALTGPQAIDPKAAGTYVLAPVVTASGALDWSCNAAAGSTIPLKYLPTICRQ